MELHINFNRRTLQLQRKNIETLTEQHYTFNGRTLPLQ